MVEEVRLSELSVYNIDLSLAIHMGAILVQMLIKIVNT